MKRIFGIIYCQKEPGNNNYKPNLQSFIDLLPKRKKATAREITEGLKPIRECIENLPQAMPPIGEATGEEEEYEEDESIGTIAKYFLNKPDTDKTFEVRKIGKHHYIGNKHVIIKDDDIIIKEGGDRFLGTAGLW